jgi:three-Cys-motif partner protein
MHKFGGADTARKLRCLEEYLEAYSTALKGQDFKRIYIDAFAGSGDRTEVRAALPLFGEDFTEPEEVTTPGSARIAACTQPAFSQIFLVERDPKRFSALQEMTNEFPNLQFKLHKDDANAVVQKLCKDIPWHSRTPDAPRGWRGVVFLDPYGMEVDWNTVEAVAATTALDMWYFFPLMGLYRQAALQAPSISSDKKDRLNRIFGTDEWFSQWYKHPNGPTDLFDDPISAVRTADVNQIEKYIHERLLSVFRGTVLAPLRLYNDRGAPLASLFFAVSNPSTAAVRVATKIASHILKRGKSSQRRSR